MKLSGGAIMIGSLYWRSEDQIRESWHRDHLDFTKAVRVLIPIRYGRLSKNNAYTNVFSKICYRKGYRLGIGWAVPFKHNIYTVEQIFAEAIALARAECNDSTTNDLCRSWFTVAVLLNPNCKFRLHVKRYWSQLMKPHLLNHNLLKYKLKSETPCIDSAGFLQIRWPRLVENPQKYLNWDFALSTPTVPTLSKNRYPSAKQIACAWIEADDLSYFIRNMESGILTFQDKLIWHYLKSKKPELEDKFGKSSSNLSN